MNQSSVPEWTVREVTPHEDFTLSVVFADGSRKVVDMQPVIDEGGVFKKLRNPALFRQAHVVGSSVEWTDEIDIAPEFLYENGVEE